MLKEYKVSAIVPVFNEEKTVARIIKALLKSQTVDEVICINDGSTDKSWEILKEFGRKITLINLKENKGKGFAVVEGIKKAQGEIVCFWDADLVNPTEKHIQALLKPLLTPRVKGVIGQRQFHELVPAIGGIVAISGDRAYFRKDLLPHLKIMRQTRFGLEMFLNDVYKNKTVKVVKLTKLKALIKPQKHGRSAAKEMLEEGVEIAREVARQRKLKAKDRKIIKMLKEVKNLDEFEERVNQISDKNLKIVLVKYLMEYLQKVRKKWKKW